MFPITIKEDIWTNYLNCTGDQIYSTHTIGLVFYKYCLINAEPPSWEMNTMTNMFIDEKGEGSKG